MAAWRSGTSGRRSLRALVLTATCLVFAASAAGGQSPRHAQVTGSDFYYGVGGHKIALEIRLDQLGVIARSGVGAKGLAPFLKTRKLKLVRKFAGGLFVLRLPRRATRAAIVALARQAKSTQKRLVRDAGLVVRERQAKLPMFVTDEFIVRFAANVTRAQIDALNDKYHVVVVRRDPFVPNQFLLRVTKNSGGDALRISNRYYETGSTIFSHPNFWIPEKLLFTPNDALFGSQWHLSNSGASACLTYGTATFCGGTADADVDADKAWDISQGAPSVVIAVMDGGTEFSHEDLMPNHQLNAGEVAGNGIDDDGNGFVDDVDGWDFVAGDNSPVNATDAHGTATAGVAVARGNNTLGVSGACPTCSFIPLRVCCGASSMAKAAAFEYARSRGARIMTNSWTTTDPTASVPPAVVTAINDVTTPPAAGIVLFGAGNDPSSGWCGASYPSLSNVISVSSSSNLDRKVQGHAFGNCIDLLAPTRYGTHDPTVPQTDPAWLSQHTGTLAITTTDLSGAAGYNSGGSSCELGIAETSNTNYTNCFSGTSSATPLVSGSVGLMVSANPTLTRLDVQRLLQDTSDKIENSLGAYATGTGFSSPASGIATHAWGRLNAFEAVRIAAPMAQGGKGGVDIFLRDNRLDWGNTEKPSNYLFEPTRGFIGHWKSVDIKIDAPPLQPAPTTNAEFEALTDEAPKQGLENKVYLRVRNRGLLTAASVTAKLHWTQFGTALPALPSDFWSAFPSDSTDVSEWHPIGTSTLTNLAYSGASVAGCPTRPQPPCAGTTDAAQIASFSWTAPTPDPTRPNHFCLLAIVTSPQDPVGETTNLVVDSVTPNNNNVTHRNVAIDTTSGSLRFAAQKEFTERFFVRNPTKKALEAVLVLEQPRGWKATLDKFGFGKPFTLAAGARALLTMKVTLPDSGLTGEVSVRQDEYLGQGKRNRPMGGLTLEFRPK
jgi:Subtilase family